MISFIFPEFLLFHTSILDRRFSPVVSMYQPNDYQLTDRPWKLCSHGFELQFVQVTQSADGNVSNEEPSEHRFYLVYTNDTNH